ncbi:hypothetical protein AK830_g7333 [Neonectria ditissima]|uniref:Amidase domain-containing protein n=1 Tax=Neonectria ditissima TaxID=78410 RepID=A0A0P7BE48_9HYPO|nr:hypothetical protein AK830_g7333 [Neonectria ditissima]
MHQLHITLTAFLGAFAAAAPVGDDAIVQVEPRSRSPFAMPLCNGIKIEDATINELQRWMILKHLSSEDLVSCYIDRIKQTNGYLRSISEINPDALSIAASLDKERSKKGIRGPLHGIPFLVKDNFYTDDKHNTSEGGLVLLGGRYSREATVVSKIRAAGGVLLGHCALSEAADHRALVNFSDGYSTRVGQTRNPYNLTQLTSGSSGGSSVAVAINQAAYIPNVKTIANPYGFGQPDDIPEEYGQLITYNTLLAVGYGEWLQNWTFHKTDERHGMKSLAEMAAWNDAHNSSTGALGNSTWWFNTASGQDFYDNAIATNGTMGDVFWKAFNWGRRTAREAIDGGHAYVLANGTVIELDALIVPNDNGGGGDSACASIPSYAGYPVASVPIGQNGFDVPCGMCIYGRQWSEATLIRVASAMDDLFQWSAKPKWHNYKTAKGPWEAKWPGYACSHESLDRYACEEEES